MSRLHDALHNMPWWVLLIVGVALVAAAATDEREGQRFKPDATRLVDNVGSWCAFFLLVALVVAYFWPR